MAGHSKWANIKHKKGATDAKRGKIFTRLIKEITVAARAGGGDPDGNPRLRSAIAAGKSENMPKDNINRAIKKGTGEIEGEVYDEILYEGYGPGGVAVLVECMTDNRNRTVASIRNALSKRGGSLGTDGSVSYLFDKKGVISYDASVDEDTIMEAALEAGADDVDNSDDGGIEVTTSYEDFISVKDAMISAGHEPELAEVIEKPTTLTEVNLADAEKIAQLIDVLDELDDVQEVHTNADFSEEVMEQLSV